MALGATAFHLFSVPCGFVYTFHNLLSENLATRHFSDLGFLFRFQNGRFFSIYFKVIFKLNIIGGASFDVWMISWNKYLVFQAFSFRNSG